jgi:hypothetical protein
MSAAAIRWNWAGAAGEPLIRYPGGVDRTPGNSTLTSDLHHETDFEETGPTRSRGRRPAPDPVVGDSYRDAVPEASVAIRPRTGPGGPVAAERITLLARLLRGRRTTPWRLQLLRAGIVVTALALLGFVTAQMVLLRGEVQVIGGETAPQAASAADLYVAISDLDAQVVRIITINNAETLSANQLDGLLTYQQRSAQIDADLEQAAKVATSQPAQDTVRRLLEQLGRYREAAWQAIAVQRQATDHTPGAAPTDALGYYAQATTVLHNELLPTAKQLRDQSGAALNDAYDDEVVTAWLGIGGTLLLGAPLLGLLGWTQWWLHRRYRRLLNLGLAFATLLTAGLTGWASLVFADETGRLRTTQRQEFIPFLALSEAHAVSFDAASDTSRYLTASNSPTFQHDFETKAHCLVDGDACGSGGVSLDVGLRGLAHDPHASRGLAGDVLDRWDAYQRDHARIVSLAEGGQRTEAVAVLTGLRRGDAAFDFFHFDMAMSRSTAEHRVAFEVALRDARDGLSGWTVIPAVIMLVAIFSTWLGLRRRLAEYHEYR